MSTQASVAIEEVSEARGANRMLLSPDGRWLVLEYALSLEQPLVVRLDRRGEEPPRAARGFVGGPPGDDGAVFYVEQEGPRTLRSTAPGQRRSHVRKLGESERIHSLDGAYRVWAVGERLLALGSAGADFEALVLDTGGEVLARRTVCPGGGANAPHLVAGERVFVLCVEPGAGPEPRDALTVIALAATDLDERWRRELPAPAVIFSRPALGLSGERLLVVSQTSPEVATVEADTGEPGPQLHLPFAGAVDFVRSASPAEDAYLMWTRSGRHGAGRRGWKLLRVHDDAVDVAADRADELPPGAAARDGSRVLLAPFAGPRHSDPSTWGPEVRRYLDLVEASETTPAAD